MVFYNSLKNCAKNSNHNKLEITSRGSPSVMLRLSLLMDSAFVYINCWAHFDGSIEKWRKNLNCYRKSSSTSLTRFLSSLSTMLQHSWYSPTLVLSIKIFVLGGVVTSFSTVVCINMQNFDIHQPEGDDWSILENDVLRPLNSLVQHARGLKCKLLNGEKLRPISP